MSRLLPNHHYLQISLNGNLYEAQRIIQTLPGSERILIEVGTPLIKETGIFAITQITNWWAAHLSQTTGSPIPPYIVADLKCMDRAETEVFLAKSAGASAATVLGSAPIETIKAFIAACSATEIDSMLDMMNIDKPYAILRQLPKPPTVIMLHRGVDETNFSDKPLPIHMINKIKGSSSVLISIAGGDTEREVQSAVFNGADIVVLWKDFYNASGQTSILATNFLKRIK